MAILSFENAFDPDFKAPESDVNSLIEKHSAGFSVDPVLIKSQSRLESGQAVAG